MSEPRTVAVTEEELEYIYCALHHCASFQGRQRGRVLVRDLFRRMRETPAPFVADESGQCQWCGVYSSEGESDRQVVDVPLMLAYLDMPAFCADCYAGIGKWAQNVPHTSSQPPDGPNDGEKDASL